MMQVKFTLQDEKEELILEAPVLLLEMIEKHFFYFRGLLVIAESKSKHTTFERFIKIKGESPMSLVMDFRNVKGPN